MGQPLKVRCLLIANRIPLTFLAPPPLRSPGPTISSRTPNRHPVVKNCNIYHRYEAIMAEKNNHTQNEAVASFLQTASAIVKPPASSGGGSFNMQPQRKMPAADVVIHFQKRGRIIELAGLQPHPAISPELLQVFHIHVSSVKTLLVLTFAGIFRCCFSCGRLPVRHP